MKSTRAVVLIITAVFILGMSLLIANQPSERIPVLMAATIAVVIIGVLIAWFLERRSR